MKHIPYVNGPSWKSVPLLNVEKSTLRLKCVTFFGGLKSFENLLRKGELCKYTFVLFVIFEWCLQKKERCESSTLQGCIFYKFLNKISSLPFFYEQSEFRDSLCQGPNNWQFACVNGWYYCFFVNQSMYYVFCCLKVFMAFKLPIVIPTSNLMFKS